ncbi:hypothetical protein FRC06_002158 [Ceratobasidium sp. 370]|nr:hypothetical protein FRC06_002158 [Ceratobasidium sp. 370]
MSSLPHVEHAIGDLGGPMPRSDYILWLQKYSPGCDIDAEDVRLDEKLKAMQRGLQQGRAKLLDIASNPRTELGRNVASSLLDGLDCAVESPDPYFDKISIRLQEIIHERIARIIGRHRGTHGARIGSSSCVEG